MSYLLLNKVVAPNTPASTKGFIYSDSNGTPHYLDGSGVDNVLANRDLPNFVRNSGFWFAQRQAPTSLTTYSSTTGRAFGPDGWAITNENASVQYKRVDNGVFGGLQSPHFGEFTKITSTGKMFMSQCIEFRDMACLRGRTVRLQCKLRGVTTNATWRLGLIQNANAGTPDLLPGSFITAPGGNGVDPTLGSNIAFIAPTAGITADGGTVSGNAISCTTSSLVTFSRFGGVFTVPTNCWNLVVMIWSDSQVAAAAGIDITEVALVDGAEVQQWAPLSMSNELARVERFYTKSFASDTLPAQSVAAGAIRGYVSVAGAVAAQPLGTRFPVTMRTTSPTMTFFNPAAANAFVRNTTAGSDATATAAANTHDGGTDVTFTGIAAWTVAQAVAIHYTADAEL